jgi:hypothetical protein
MPAPFRLASGHKGKERCKQIGALGPRSQISADWSGSVNGSIGP